MGYFWGSEENTSQHERIDFDDTEQFATVQIEETYDRRNVGPDEETVSFRCPKV